LVVHALVVVFIFFNLLCNYFFLFCLFLLCRCSVPVFFAILLIHILIFPWWTCRSPYCWAAGGSPYSGPPRGAAQGGYGLRDEFVRKKKSSKICMNLSCATLSLSCAVIGGACRTADGPTNGIGGYVTTILLLFFYTQEGEKLRLTVLIDFFLFIRLLLPVTWCGWLGRPTRSASIRGSPSSCPGGGWHV
jgi:hypothetical protein